MKNDRCLLSAVLGLFAFAMIASADPDSTDPNLQYDADGVPVSISKPKTARLSPQEVAAIHKQQVQAATNKDWLVRDYEKQLKKQGADDQSANLYYQLSSNKDLAKLAGLPDISDDSSGGDAAYHANNPSSDHDSSTQRNHSSAPGTPQGGSYLKPFITPMSAPLAAGLPNFYSTLGGTSSPGRTPQPTLTPTPRSSALAEDPTDIETPGAIAAEKNPNPETLDLTLDVLPGESVEHARAHQDNDSLLSLQLPPGADQLHLAQSAAMNPSGLPGSTTTTPTVPMVPKAIPVNDEDAPTPASKTPVINPVRAPIANPYDILNR